MDVRVKVGKRGSSQPDRQEILTGLRERTLRNVFHQLAVRHPDLADLIRTADEAKSSLQIFVNNDLVPAARTDEYAIRDGDTVSLFVM